MGLQYGNECYCGSLGDEEKHVQYGLGDCNFLCAGDDSFNCGAFSTVSSTAANMSQRSATFSQCKCVEPTFVVEYKKKLSAPLFSRRNAISSTTFVPELCFSGLQNITVGTCYF